MMRHCKPIANAKGIFAMLPLSAAQAAYLGQEYAIYLPVTGRINLAGLSSNNAAKFVDGVLASKTAV